MKKLNILDIDRSIRDNEQGINDIFEKYVNEYDLIVQFALKGENPNWAVTFYFSFSNQYLLSEINDLFNLNMRRYDSNETDNYIHFFETGIEESNLYDVLKQKFEINLSKLTNIDNFNRAKAQFVIDHAKKKRKKGKNISLIYKGERNPNKALALAIEDIEFMDYRKVERRNKYMSALDLSFLIGTGDYCPDCGGLCGNDKHTRRW